MCKLYISKTDTHDPRLTAQARVEHYKELCRCLRLQKTVGVGVYKTTLPWLSENSTVSMRLP